MKQAQSGFLRVLASIFQARAKVDRSEVDRLADNLEREGVFDDIEGSAATERFESRTDLKPKKRFA